MSTIAADKTSLTTGPIWKKMLMFAIPIFIGNIFQQLYNTVDSLIAGNYLGEEALAAVSSSGSLIFLLVGFFNGAAMGAGIAMAKYYGAKEYDKLQDSIHTDIAFGLVAGIAMTIVGVLFTPHILKLMGTPAEVLPESTSYFRYYFLGGVSMVMYNIFTGILRAVGDSTRPLYYLIISSVINIILDFVFIAGLGFGVEGAAIATTIAQTVSAIMCLIRLMQYDTVYRVYLEKIGIKKYYLKEIIKFGLPSGVQNSIIAIANVVVQSNINQFGPMAMAGCGSYSKIEGFAFLPITCFSMALTTFIGQNLGAKQYDRAKKGAKFGIVCSTVGATIIGIGIFVFAPYLIGIFNDKAEVIEYGVKQCHVEALFYFLLAFSHCIAGIMRGAGKPMVPMFTMLATWCLTRITYITIAVRIVPKIEMIFWAYPLTWSLSSIIFLITFLKSDWIHGFVNKE